MGLFEQFPYTNFQEKNLDRIGSELGDLERAVASTTESAASAAENAASAAASESSAAASAATATEQADRAANYAANIADPVGGIVADWMAANIHENPTVVIDSSLTVQGAAADAKAVGTTFNRSRENFTPVPLGNYFPVSSTFSVWTDMPANSVYEGTPGAFKNSIVSDNIQWHDSATYQVIKIRDILYISCPSYNQFAIGLRRISDGTEFWTSEANPRYYPTGNFNAWTDIPAGFYYQGLPVYFKDSITTLFEWHSSATYQMHKIGDLLYIACPSYQQFFIGIRRITDNAEFWYSGGTGGGDTIYNTYDYDFVTNQYTIETVSPTLQGDVLYVLQPTGDTTDRAADIAAMFSQYGVCRLAPGNFYVSNLTVPNYCSLIGSGIGRTVIYGITGYTGAVVTVKTRASVSDLVIHGGGSVGSAEVDRHGISWQGTFVNPQNPGTHPVFSRINDIHITNCGGAGLLVSNVGTSSLNGYIASNITIRNCYAGIILRNYAEYVQLTNINVGSCTYGVINNGGNNIFSNCNFSANTNGILIDDSQGQSPNNSHGTFSACTINHTGSNTGKAIEILGADHGEIFQGCQIHYGSINITGSLGVRFVGCVIGSTVPLNINSSTSCGFDASIFLAHLQSPLTGSGNTALTFNNCYDETGSLYNPVQ